LIFVLKGLVMKKEILLALILCLVVNSFSYGALNAYMRLVGEVQGEIKGSVTQAGRENSIMVIGFNHDVFSPRSVESGLPNEGRQHSPLCITKEIDKSTPLLMNAWSRGETMKHFELRFYRPTSAGTELQYYSILLYDAQIVSIRQEMLNNKYPDNMSHNVRENVTFVYKGIQWVYEDGGILFEDDWKYDGASLLISDLSGDGMVDLLDLAIFANQWLEGTK